MRATGPRDWLLRAAGPVRSPADLQAALESLRTRTAQIIGLLRVAVALALLAFDAWCGLLQRLPDWRLTLPLSLSWDHRVIDGAAAARFNVYFANVLADLRRVLF